MEKKTTALFDENKECYCSLCEKHYKNYKRFRIHMINIHYPETKKIRKQNGKERDKNI